MASKYNLVLKASTEFTNNASPRNTRKLFQNLGNIKGQTTSENVHSWLYGEIIAWSISFVFPFRLEFNLLAFDGAATARPHS